MTVLILEGWPAAGKTALWALLDGHPEIFVEPLHTYFYQIIFELFQDQNERRRVTIREFRKAASATEYYKIEQISAAGYYEMTAAHNLRKKFIFEFDFNSFDEKNIEYILKHGNDTSAEEMLAHMTEQFCKCYGLNNIPKYFVAMSDYYAYKRNNILKFDRLFKVLTVIRDPIEIYASRISRTARLEDGKETNNFAPDIKKLAREAEIEEICAFNIYYETLQRLRSDLYFYINLDNLLTDKRNSIRSISEFLSVEVNDIMLKGTRDGCEFETVDFALTQKVNDEAKALLSPYLLRSVQVRRLIFSFHRKPFNIFNLSSILRYFYLRYRGYR
jgi:hypothetical protein